MNLSVETHFVLPQLLVDLVLDIIGRIVLLLRFELVIVVSLFGCVSGTLGLHCIEFLLIRRSEVAVLKLGVVGAQTILNVLFKSLEHDWLERKQIKFKLLFFISVVLENNRNDAIYNA